MHNNFKVLGLSFKDTPLAIREKLALNEGDSRRLIDFIKDFTPAGEALVLSTCNRTEIYYNYDADLSTNLMKGLGLIKDMPATDIVPHISNETDHQKSIKHLFYVAMGLEAQVVGDLQISNQVKRAYQWSADADMAGPFLHRLMHTIFFTNKRVIQETSFRDGAASVSYAAKDLVDTVTSDFIDPKVLILGVGEIGADVCRNLMGSRFKDVTVINRTLDKSTTLAAECGFKAASFDRVTEALEQSDVIISSIFNNIPFITKPLVENFEILSHKYFVDLSVPRSIAPEVEDIPGVLLYNIDDIHSKASAALDKRIAAVPAVKAIIQEAIDEFNDWSKEMIVSPTIKKLKNALEEIRKEELARYLKDAKASEVKIAETVTKSMMQKVMKLPVLQLKAACKRGEAETLIDVLNDLFDLEKQSEVVKK